MIAGRSTFEVVRPAPPGQETQGDGASATLTMAWPTSRSPSRWCHATAIPPRATAWEGIHDDDVSERPPERTRWALLLDVCRALGAARYDATATSASDGG